MFIYRITVPSVQKSYIGFDTKPTYKEHRWKVHQRNARNGSISKLYNYMRKFGIDRCTYEVIADGFDNIVDLALAEIELIKQYDTHHNGLNSSPGGDGFGRRDLSNMNEEDIAKIKAQLGNHFSQYNNNVKWAGADTEERKRLTEHLHTDEVYQKKSDSLKQFYKNNPEARTEKGRGIREWQKNNKERLRQNNISASQKAAEKTSIRLKVACPDGNVLYFKSKNEFKRKTGLWAVTVLSNTKQGKTFNGYQAWEIKDE